MTDTTAKLVQSAPVDSGELKTSWAEDTSPGFDADQLSIHRWAHAGAEEFEAVLSSRMTLADVEQLAYEAAQVAREHRDRAESADALSQAVLHRAAKDYLSNQDIADSTTASKPQEGK